MSHLILPSRWKAASYDALTAGRHVLIGASEVVFETQTAYQHLVIAEVPEFGRALFLDGNVQLMAIDEDVYHERIALLPVLAHPTPKHVLILGGGDGCAAREALRDPGVERVTLVDLDPGVVEACRQHLAAMNAGSLDNARVQVHTVDARLFLTPEQLATVDVVIIDFLDAFSVDELRLYDEVLAATAAHVNPQAILSVHGDLTAPPYWPALRLLALARRHFPQVVLHEAFVNSYGSNWGFMLAGHDPALAERLTGPALRARAARLAQPVATLNLDLFPTLLQPTPKLARLIETVARDPFALPGEHEPETSWLTV
jgi:spermidine synthase